MTKNEQSSRLLVSKNKNLPSYSSSTHPRLAADAVEVGTCSSGNTEVIAVCNLPLPSACGQLTSARSPKHIAEATLYFSGRVPKNRSSNKFLVIPLLLLVYHKIRRLSTNLCAFPPAAYVLTDLESVGIHVRFQLKRNCSLIFYFLSKRLSNIIIVYL